MQQRSLQQVRVSVSVIFLIHRLIIATWASRIPAFQAHLHLSPAVLGRSLMMAAIGSVLAMPAAGWLINKFGILSLVIGSTLGFGLALRVALAGADASLFERYPAEGTPKLTVYREAQRASYLDLPVKTHDP